MGLIKHLLFWPVTGPMFLTEFALDKVQGVVRERLTDDTEIKAQLLELQMQLEMGEIDDDEYVRREGQIMQQLREVREWREHFGMGVSGGPVRVAQPTPEERKEAEDAGPATPPPSEGGEQGGPKVASPDEVTIELNFDDWH